MKSIEPTFVYSLNRIVMRPTPLSGSGVSPVALPITVLLLLLLLVSPARPEVFSSVSRVKAVQGQGAWLLGQLTAVLDISERLKEDVHRLDDVRR